MIKIQNVGLLRSNNALRTKIVKNLVINKEKNPTESMNLKHLSIHLKERLSTKLEESKAERHKGSIEMKKYIEEISYLKKKATNEGSGEQLDFIVVNRKGMLGVNRGGDYEAVGGVRKSDNMHYQGEYNEDNNQYVVGSVTGSPIVYDMFIYPILDPLP